MKKIWGYFQSGKMRKISGEIQKASKKNRRKNYRRIPGNSLVEIPGTTSAKASQKPKETVEKFARKTTKNIAGETLRKCWTNLQEKTLRAIPGKTLEEIPEGTATETQ